jgi:1,4-alpha-glucan branching enzyme
MTENGVIAHSLLTDFDTSLFGAGKHFKLYEKMGSTPMEVDGVAGTYFAVWAPNAEKVSVIGNFNKWNKTAHVLNARWDHSGIWEGFLPGVKEGDVYKYAVKIRGAEAYMEKGDPYAREWECPPKTASVVRKLNMEWSDGTWMKNRKKNNSLDAPISVYEVHLGSWKRKPEDNNRSLTYREMADELVPYVKKMGFTHVEFMPVMEHPFFGSWGYQITGYFAASSRFGSPEDFGYLVNAFHKAGIGVFVDWVPSHFPGDMHGLFRFDGTSLYEHEDHRLGFHPDWKSYIFNYGRHEVRSFLISNALYWLDVFHIDGIRVDAVASMLYLDYSRKEGEWIPNRFGGRENLEAVSLLKEMNEAVYSSFPDVQTIAEESTSWPMVSRPVADGGLGFGIKWMMGWMNDILEYTKENPIYRRFHQNKLTFSLVYAFTENFMLPLSHDEVVHGKGSLLSRMPGDEWQRFANIRALYAWMYTHPGAKLLFMGDEFAQFSEWKHDESLLWNLLGFQYHEGVSNMVTELNALYKTQTPLYEQQFSSEGFEWIDYGDTKNSVISFYRKGKATGKKPGKRLLVVGNFTPATHENYRIGVDERGTYKEVFNSDSARFGGSGLTNDKVLNIDKIPSHGRANSIEMKLPPLGFVILEPAK